MRLESADRNPRRNRPQSNRTSRVIITRIARGKNTDALCFYCVPLHKRFSDVNGPADRISFRFFSPRHSHRPDHLSPDRITHADTTRAAKIVSQMAARPLYSDKRAPALTFIPLFAAQQLGALRRRRTARSARSFPVGVSSPRSGVQSASSNSCQRRCLDCRSASRRLIIHRIRSSVAGHAAAGLRRVPICIFQIGMNLHGTPKPHAFLLASAFAADRCTQFFSSFAEFHDKLHAKRFIALRSARLTVSTDRSARTE